jgi:Na+-transporting methylmalonyl-CoA/oxaloacetate decarboxylase gamma subunit
MIEQLRQASLTDQGLFIAAVGLAGVFIVLVLFFFAIKVITALFK